MDRKIHEKPSVKVVLYGRSGAGKSALMMRYVYDRFENGIENTIGAAFNSKNLFIDGTSITLQIWDTAGSERFNSIVPIYIRGAKIVLLCFDNPDISEIQLKLSKIYEIARNVQVFLVATKMDIADSNRYPEIDKFAHDNQYRLFYTSSMKGVGVEYLFDTAASIGLKMTLEEESKYPKPITLDDRSTKDNICCRS